MARSRSGQCFFPLRGNDFSGKGFKKEKIERSLSYESGMVQIERMKSSLKTAIQIVEFGTGGAIEFTCAKRHIATTRPRSWRSGCVQRNLEQQVSKEREIGDKKVVVTLVQFICSACSKRTKQKAKLLVSRSARRKSKIH